MNVVTEMIPRIKELLRKEKKHLEFLESIKKTYPEISKQINTDQSISESKLHIEHYETRLTEYENFNPTK